jgi:serine/threonine-protein kinase
VTLKVAVGAPVNKVTVPSGLIGDLEAVARSSLAAVGLNANVVDKASNTVTKGVVISTSPASGARTAQGNPVTLYVSSGPSNVPVPSVLGFTPSAASSALVNVGLVVGIESQDPSSSYPAGTVFATNPGAGTQVPPGSTVNLGISTGTAPTTTTTTSSTTTTSTTSPSSSTSTTGGGGGGGGGGGTNITGTRSRG